MRQNAIMAESRYQRLLKYLQEGWSIHPPVFVHLMFYRNRTSDAYHFILERAESHQLLVVPRSEQVDRFINEKRLPLNRL